MSRGKVKKHRLNIGEEINFSLYGIVTSEPVYKVALLMNSLPGVSLKSIAPVETEIYGGNKISFPRFADLSLLPDSWLAIVSNRYENNFLFRKLRNIDLILVSYPEETDEASASMLNSIKELKGITAVFPINPNQSDTVSPEILFPLF